MTTRAVAVLLCVFAVAGCKKKPPVTTDEAGATDDASEAGAATEGGASADAAGEASSDEASTEAGGAGAATDTDSTDGGSSPTTTGGGAGYAGSYSCFGGLTLNQTHNTVSGNGSARTASSTQSTDVTCRISGDKCSGTFNTFSSMNGGQPKPTGKGKITLRMAGNNLEYTQVFGGSTQTGICKRR
jgi:hypothetical protein